MPVSGAVRTTLRTHTNNNFCFFLLTIYSRPLDVYTLLPLEGLRTTITYLNKWDKNTFSLNFLTIRPKIYKYTLLIAYVGHFATVPLMQLDFICELQWALLCLLARANTLGLTTFAHSDYTRNSIWTICMAYAVCQRWLFLLCSALFWSREKCDCKMGK